MVTPTIGLCARVHKVADCTRSLIQESRHCRSNCGLPIRETRRPVAPERLTKPRLVDPPEVVLDPVHERHRNLIPVRSTQSGVVKDRELNPGDAEVSGHPFDHCPRRAAQMTAGFGDEGDPRRGVFRHGPNSMTRLHDDRYDG